MSDQDVRTEPPLEAIGNSLFLASFHPLMASPAFLCLLPHHSLHLHVTFSSVHLCLLLHISLINVHMTAFRAH